VSRTGKRGGLELRLVFGLGGVMKLELLRVELGVPMEIGGRVNLGAEPNKHSKKKHE